MSLVFISVWGTAYSGSMQTVVAERSSSQHQCFEMDVCRRYETDRTCFKVWRCPLGGNSSGSWGKRFVFNICCVLIKFTVFLFIALGLGRLERTHWYYDFEVLMTNYSQTHKLRTTQMTSHLMTDESEMATYIPRLHGFNIELPHNHNFYLIYWKVMLLLSSVYAVDCMSNACHQNMQ